MTESTAPYGNQPGYNGNVLLEAFDLINHDRQGEYGPPAESFGLFANLLSIWFRHKVTPHDAAMCMVLLKISREACKHKHDNLVDAAGYIALAADLAALAEQQAPAPGEEG